MRSHPFHFIPPHCSCDPPKPTGYRQRSGPVGREALSQTRGSQNSPRRIWCQTSLWGINRNYPIKTMELMRKSMMSGSLEGWWHIIYMVTAMLSNKVPTTHTGLLKCSWSKRRCTERVAHTGLKKLVSKDNCEIANDAHFNISKSIQFLRAAK